VGAPYLLGDVYVVWVSIRVLCGAISKEKGRDVLTEACASCRSIVGHCGTVSGYYSQLRLLSLYYSPSALLLSVPLYSL
jgi:hypothetical protein